jgi:hypothetical protein
VRIQQIILDIPEEYTGDSGTYLEEEIEKLKRFTYFNGTGREPFIKTEDPNAIADWSVKGGFLLVNMWTAVGDGNNLKSQFYPGILFCHDGSCYVTFGGKLCSCPLSQYQ